MGVTEPQVDTGLPAPAACCIESSDGVGDVGYEEVPRDKGEMVREAWFAEIRHRLQETDLGQNIIDFVCKSRPGVPMGLDKKLMSGSFNCSFKVRFEDGSAALLRVPIPAMCAFADAKVMTEAATMLYVAERTTIPVPKVYHYGPASQNPTGLGTAFIIMEYIPHYTSVSEALHHPADIFSWMPAKEQHFYRQMADIMLQLSELESPVIGRLGMEDGGFDVCGGPITLAMNDMVVNDGTPEEAFPPLHETYPTTHDWFLAVADTQIARMLFGDSEDEEPEDARENRRAKFVARYLFRDMMARRARETGETFNLWCDDLRPSSVLIDEHGSVVGVVDWEFTYFAPSSYVSELPYWLLTDGFPDDDEDVQEFMDKLPQRTEAFLEAFKAEEEALELAKRRQKREIHGVDSEVEGINEQTEALDLQDGEVKLTPIHDRMRKQSGRCNGAEPINMAVRLSWMFDSCFWDDIDEETFGANKTCDYHSRLELLPAHARDLMEEFALHKRQEGGDKDPRCLLEGFLAKLEGAR